MAPSTPTATATPTATDTPQPTASATTTATAAPVACSERMPHGDLFALVTRDFGLSRDFEPGDLTPLSEHFDVAVTLGYPTEVSAQILEPLQTIVGAMQAQGLAPQIVSGYRSYSEQALAFRKWLTEYPDWGSFLSAPPGHSEHQLGTTVDFGSRELKYMLGEAYVQFHPAFAQTSEGKWLAEHAAAYGFTMSYPEDAFEQTAFYPEPWHFRYVGKELAMALAADGITLTEYLLQRQPVPCIAD